MADVTRKTTGEQRDVLDEDATWVPPVSDKPQWLHRKKDVFMDRRRLKVEAGRGGDGCVSFFRDNKVSRGPPTGGHGGAGGNVIIVANENYSNLRSVPTNYVRAQRGENGRKDKRAGKAGDDVIIEVPLGTLIKEIIEEPEPEEDEMDLFDFMEDKKKKKKEVKYGAVVDLDHHLAACVVAKGGRGGVGNRVFKSGSNRSPKTFTEGSDGAKRKLELELKMIASVGLVGFPNAGKSTLISNISNARPRIASYPFTTLRPYIGIVPFIDGSTFSVADIPGIVEGAHKNKGLGLNFLRHIERTQVLCYVIDMNKSETDAPVREWKTLMNELEAYSEGMTNRPSVVVGNKTDLPLSQDNIDFFCEEVSEFCREKEREDIAVIGISAKERDGLDQLVYTLKNILENVDTSQHFISLNNTDGSIEDPETE
eukprot:CAMPEP_0174270724 /NCGR_PEP_ID=MMETSP0439-20130205/45509_1 /TAXON_ID=0 /ORGANISM="Stereomyxa ramosa, Strain Chinc5" /LENGTH=424 /DNA_ID=CAMNT_0015360225 /DNA_START=130 /DNA_END=1404 /DNA_ORIENTATION=+